jgi:hypothetical protein
VQIRIHNIARYFTFQFKFIKSVIKGTPLIMRQFSQVQPPKPPTRKEAEPEEEEEEEVSSDDSGSSGFLTHDTFEEHFSAKKAARKSPLKR